MVSVIIPNYCHARYLKQRIDSVLAQTYSDIEVVLLDDCSTDSSREILESYRSHPRIKQIVYNDRNSGSAFAQWQKGFALTGGEYIWIAESDDYADPTFLERCVAALDSDSDCVIAHTLSRTESDVRPARRTAACSSSVTFCGETNSTMRAWPFSAARHCLQQRTTPDSAMPATGCSGCSRHFKAT